MIKPSELKEKGEREKEIEKEKENDFELVKKCYKQAKQSRLHTKLIWVLDYGFQKARKRGRERRKKKKSFFIESR